MERLTRLDGLRGVLAVYVMLGHALPYTNLPGWAGALFVHGEAAVDMFFALSGLVVVQSLERFEYKAAPFLKGRARRLLPVYFTVLVFAVLLIEAGSPLPSMPWIIPGSLQAEFWALGLPAHFGWHLVAHVTLVQGLLPQGLLPWAFITLLGPAWSLSTEWQFYIVLALLMRRVRNLMYFGFALLALGILYRLANGFLPPYWQFSRAFLPDAAPFFVLGVMSAVWLRTGKAWPLVAAVLVTMLLGVASGVPGKILMPLGWALVFWVQVKPVLPWLGRILDSDAAQFLGKISYPLYLLNAPVQRACAMIVAPLVHADVAVFTWVWLPPAVLMPVVAAVALHYWIEAPFMRVAARRSPLARG